MGNVTPEKVLRIGIERVILHHRQLVLVHPAYRVAAAAAYTQDLDEGYTPGYFRHGIVRIAGVSAGFPGR